MIIELWKGLQFFNVRNLAKLLSEHKSNDIEISISNVRNFLGKQSSAGDINWVMLEETKEEPIGRTRSITPASSKMKNEFHQHKAQKTNSEWFAHFLTPLWPIALRQIRTDSLKRHFKWSFTMHRNLTRYHCASRACWDGGSLCSLISELRKRVCQAINARGLIRRECVMPRSEILAYFAVCDLDIDFTETISFHLLHSLLLRIPPDSQGD